MERTGFLSAARGPVGLDPSAAYQRAILDLNVPDT